MDKVNERGAAQRQLPAKNPGAWALTVAMLALAGCSADDGSRSAAADTAVEARGGALTPEDRDPAPSPADTVKPRIPLPATRWGEPLAADGSGAGSTPATRASASSTRAFAGHNVTVEGAFGPLFDWPVIPLHTVLLPNGRVMAFGSDTAGRQGALLHYTVWNPALGTGSNAFTLLANTTATDIFCAAQTVLPGSGNVLIVGGDRSFARRNYGVADVNLWNPVNSFFSKKKQPMAFRRWYPTLLTTAAGEQLVLGGRDSRDLAAENGFPATTATYAPTPEIYNPVTGWRSLTGATSSRAYGDDISYYYPRAWVAPNGKVFVYSYTGEGYFLDTNALGTLTQVTPSGRAYPKGSAAQQDVMFAPGKILTMRNVATDGSGRGRAFTIDLNSDAPNVAEVAMTSQRRIWGFATVLADGKVFLNGGSTVDNQLQGTAFHSETWDPATNTWTRGASATVPRLYHSTSLMLADGSVLTAGGGAQGPVDNLNGEIYYPPYLFKTDGSGDFAERPVITSAPEQQLGWAQGFDVSVSGGPVSRVTLVRSGSATHSFNADQRFRELSFTQDGDTVHLSTPDSSAVAPAGYYLLFVFNAAGVPSVAKMIRINA